MLFQKGRSAGLVPCAVAAFLLLGASQVQAQCQKGQRAGGRTQPGTAGIFPQFQQNRGMTTIVPQQPYRQLTTLQQQQYAALTVLQLQQYQQNVLQAALLQQQQQNVLLGAALQQLQQQNALLGAALQQQQVAPQLRALPLPVGR